MAREVVHIYFEHPRISKPETLGIFIPALIFTTLYVIVLDIIFRTIDPLSLAIIIGVLWLVFGGLMVLWYKGLKFKGENLPEELIIYDNGWFIVWGPVYSDGWVAPAKLDWILPDKIEMRAWGILRRIFIPKEERKKKRKLFYKGVEGKIESGIGLSWVYPLNKKYKDYLFLATVDGYITEEQYKTLKKLAGYLDRIGRKNLESGRVWIPSGKPQASSIYLKKPFYWNDVFKKERLKEYYMEDTGEEIPEPVSSFLFDVRKYINEYLKKAKETGDWFGREGVKKEWYIDWEWLEKWIEEH